MTASPDLTPIKQYFERRLEEHGATPRGADWNSAQAQEARFDQLLKVVDFSKPFTLLDYGSGYGALAQYLHRLGADFEYRGFDILPDMVAQGQALFKDDPRCRFSTQMEDLGPVDYTVVSGTFNIRLESSNEDWTRFVFQSLDEINRVTRRGFSFNLLTSYSDAEHMKDYLYYADPCRLFDHCKRHYARNVALLHDYGLYDFTILVRKERD